MWSPTSIPGKPALLVADASRNVEGWESDFGARLYSSLSRRGMGLVGDGPITARDPDDLLARLGSLGGYNCILLLGHGSEDPQDGVAGHWARLATWEALPPLLLALCTWDQYDPSLSRRVLEPSEGPAAFALAPQSPLTAREAGLFYLKFFTELDLHSTDAISGRMVWFAWSKAKELLRKRKLQGVVGARC